MNAAALEDLVRQAMAAGAGYFAENFRTGQLDGRSLGECFEDFPAEFLAIRTDLTDALNGGDPK